jgi:hypothetical protein
MPVSRCDAPQSYRICRLFAGLPGIGRATHLFSADNHV